MVAVLRTYTGTDPARDQAPPATASTFPDEHSAPPDADDEQVAAVSPADPPAGTPVQSLSTSALRDWMAEIRRCVEALGDRYVHRGDHIEVSGPDGTVHDRLYTTEEIAGHIAFLEAGGQAAVTDGEHRARAAEAQAKEEALVAEARAKEEALVAEARAKERALTAETRAKEREIETLRGEVERVKTDNTVLRAKGESEREEREQLQWEVTHLREMVSRYHATTGENGNGNGAGDGFSRVKKEFAKLYHPNKLAQMSTIERTVRTEIFKEFWTIIEGIEKDQKK